MTMNKLGVAIILMWVSIAHILYPLPTQLTDDFERFVNSDMEIYLQTLSESQKTEFLSNREEHINASIAKNTVATWAKWSAKFILLIAGVLVGWAIYSQRVCWCPALATSIAFEAMWAFQTVPSLSALGFGEFIKAGARTASPIFVLLFYEYFLVLPILHLFLIGYFLYRMAPQSRR